MGRSRWLCRGLGEYFLFDFFGGDLVLMGATIALEESLLLWASRLI